MEIVLAGWCLLVPKAKTREKIEQDGTKLTLSGIKDDKTRGPVCVRVNTLNNLPMSYGYDMGNIHTSTQAFTSIVQTTSIHNHNLAEPAKELLRWHERLGHLGFKKVQLLLRTSIPATSESTRRMHTAAANLTILPLCAACQYGKQKRRPSPGITHKLVKDRNTVTKQNNLYPGQCISTKGRLFTSHGKTKNEDMYVGGAIRCRESRLEPRTQNKR